MLEWWLSTLKAQGREKVQWFQCVQEGTDVRGTCTNVYARLSHFLCNLCADVLPKL